ncbi:metallophosphoesterase family protein [Teichococcus oryzae]|uniref:metallophosphoesterase family protein n=1 Tax=Teichococcus oryzae TaxID=1608942 RepID=UPI0013760CD4|nr:DNA repair exonuclease [Pseudoroseomonas oryzae]
MPSFRFLHAADLHLDSPLRGLDADLSAPAARIRGASREALAALVDVALGEKVDFVVIAGDLYDGDWSDFRTGQALVASLAKLTRAGIRVVAIRGNHDAESQITRDLRLPDGATLLSTRRPESLVLEEHGVVLHGQSFASRDVTDNIAMNYPAPRPGLFNLALLHTAATGRPGHASYAPCTVEQLARHGYDYWALGHIHTREEVLRDPWIVFPGNLQGRHINEAGAKGASLVTVRDNRVVAVEHRTLDVVRWQRIVVDCSGAADEEAVLNRVLRAMGEAAGAAEGRLLALRLELSGPTAAHATLSRNRADTLGRLRAAALEAVAEEDFWIEGVRLNTRPAAPALARNDAVGRLLDALAAPQATELPDLADYARQLLDRAPGLREALGPDHPAVQAAEGQLGPEWLARARDLILARLAEG